MNDLIETLKKNQIPFGLLLPEEKACFRKVGKKNCVIYTYTGWERTDGISYADISTYAIKKKYQPEPEFVDLEIKLEGGFLGANVEGRWFDEVPYSFIHLHCLPSLPNFDDFWYQDSPGCKFFGIKETAIARCRFEGKKVFARFRKS